MASPLQVAAAEIVIKDLASKSAVRLEKNINKTFKGMRAAEKQTGKTGKALDKFSKSEKQIGKTGKALDKFSKSEKQIGKSARPLRRIEKPKRVDRPTPSVQKSRFRGAAGGAGRRFAGGIASGSLTGILSAVPIFGAVFAAAAAAVRSKKSRFMASVVLNKKLLAL